MADNGHTSDGGISGRPEATGVSSGAVMTPRVLIDCLARILAEEAKRKAS